MAVLKKVVVALYSLSLIITIVVSVQSISHFSSFNSTYRDLWWVDAIFFALCLFIIFLESSVIWGVLKSKRWACRIGIALGVLSLPGLIPAYFNFINLLILLAGVLLFVDRKNYA